MKKIVIAFLLFSSFTLFSQEDLDVVTTEKATVYIVRTSNIGMLINFTYFDGEQLIGKFKGRKYLKYVCNPGKRVFWTRSENKSFIEADLEGGKAYILQAVPVMGAVKAQVKLVPIDKNHKKFAKIKKMINKKKPFEMKESKIEELQSDMKEVLFRGMEKYRKLKADGEEFDKLTPEMSFTAKELK